MEDQTHTRGPGRPRRAETNSNNLRDVADAIRAQATATNNLMNFFTQGGPGHVGPGVAPPAHHHEDPNQMFFKFYKLNPPTFSGGSNAMAAQYWLEAIEKIYQVVQCTEEQKVTFATHMLSEEAENWWKGERAHLVAVGTPQDWNHFKEAFLNKYFPTTLKKQKDREFMQLKQGEMTVAEYVNKFEELARYSSHVRYAADEEWKIDQFKWGLRADIRNCLAQITFTSYATLVHQSYVAEESLNSMFEEKQLRWQKKKDEGKSSQHSKVKGNLNKGKQAQEVATVTPRGCPNCGKFHKGVCMTGQDICFYCRQSGHVQKNCPKLKQGRASGPNDPTQGRVFALSAKKAKGVDNLIKDKGKAKEK